MRPATQRVVVPPSCTGWHRGLDEFAFTVALSDVLPPGQQARGSALFDVWASSFVGTNVDQIPGGPGSFITAPERAKAHVFVGSAPVGTEEEGTVSLSIDGGPAFDVETATGTFQWAHDVGLLDDGDHTITAVLDVGETSVSDSVDVSIRGGLDPDHVTDGWPGRPRDAADRARFFVDR